jgi:hypothetical protein
VTESREDPGEPALKIAGLRIWIHGREHPDAMDAGDGNWLQVTAQCEASGASVFVRGPILEVTDIVRFGHQAQLLLDGKAVRAALDTLEPELSAVIDSPDAMGHFRLHVEISPDHLSQNHAFDFEIDQSYLPGLVRQCAQIANEYPVRSG